MTQQSSVRRWVRLIPRTSKTYRLVAMAMAIGFAMPATTALAQDAKAGTGTVSGRVLNATTGVYLDKAVVTVEGTNIQVFTDETGRFEIADLPPGAKKLVIKYTGLSPTVESVDVSSGKNTNLDVKLSRSRLAKTKDKDTVELEEFVVATERFRNAAEIAINEERYSPNLKNVVAADAFGDIPEGNIGEFVKFIPGVQITYGGTYTSDADATGIGVRGFGPDDTAITIDGVPVSSANPGSLSRAVTLDMLSINNASRVEVVKVPTPDMPSNSIGGQVNLITKRASEYAKPQFDWRVYTSINSEETDFFKKTPGPTNKSSYKTRPGADFSWIFPMSSKFGFSITGATSNQFNPSHRASMSWQSTPIINVDLRPIGGLEKDIIVNAKAEQSNLANPFLKKYSLTDAPRFSNRHSIGLNADWSPWKSQTFQMSYNYAIYDSADVARRIDFSAEKPMDWGSDYTTGRPYVSTTQSKNGKAYDPGNKTTINIDSRDKVGNTHTGYLKHIFSLGGWKMETTGSLSVARGSYKDMENGHFSGVDMKIDLGQTIFRDIKDGIPGSISIFDRSGNPIDYTNLSNWKLDSFKAKSGLAESRDTNYIVTWDLSRELDFFPWSRVLPMTFKTGFRRDSKKVEKWGVGTGYQMLYTGPTMTTSDYIDAGYQGISPGFGAPAQQWPSTYAIYDLYVAHPEYFDANHKDVVAGNWTSYVNQQKSLEDVKDAGYAMLSGKAYRNKISWVGGIRKEESTIDGRGPFTDGKWNYLKNTDGTLYRDSVYPGGVKIDDAKFINDTALRARVAAAGLSLPDHVINSTTEPLLQKQLQLIPNRKIHVKKKGDPSYSFSMGYEILKDLVARVSWSRKFGQIAYEDGGSGILSGNGAFTITENDTALPKEGGVGTIKVANPNLQPSISNDWDYNIAYYTKTGGKISLSYFTKETSNFQENLDLTPSSPEYKTLLNSLELDPADYADWTITTAINGIGVAKSDGWEIEVQQNMGEFFTWGRRFQVFANYTHKENKPKVISTKPGAKSLPLTTNDQAAAGVAFAYKRFSTTMKMTYIDWTIKEKPSVDYNGTSYYFYKWVPSEVRWDLNMNYQLTKRYGLFVNARDVFAVGRSTYQFDESGILPDYARRTDYRKFGVQWTVGVRGSF